MAGSMFIEEYVEIRVDAETCANFIQNHADGDDRKLLREELGIQIDGDLPKETLADKLKAKSLARIGRRLSLNEVFELEASIENEAVDGRPATVTNNQ